MSCAGIVHRHINVAVLLVTCNRPDNLNRTLSQIIKFVFLSSSLQPDASNDDDDDEEEFVVQLLMLLPCTLAQFMFALEL